MVDLYGEVTGGTAPHVSSRRARLAAWRDEFMEGGRAGLKGRSGAGGEPDDRALRQAERKIGELTMDNEILRAIARKRGLSIPPQKRPR